MLLHQCEICFLCGWEILTHDSAVQWEQEGNPEPIYSHATCHGKFRVLTEKYGYDFQQARRMLVQHILVFCGGD